MENYKLIIQSNEKYSQIRNTLIMVQIKVTSVVNMATVGLIRFYFIPPGAFKMKLELR